MFLFERLFSILLGSYLEVALLGHGNSEPFEKLPNCFPQSLHSFKAVDEGSNFSISLPIFVIFLTFYHGHLDGHKAVSHCGFYLHFSSH